MGGNVTALLLVKAGMKHMARVFQEVALADTSLWSQTDIQIQS